MNSVHRFLVSYIRKAVAEDRSPLLRLLTDQTDEQVAHKMFKNMRGRGTKAKGLLLSHMGLRLMENYFKSYEISRPENKGIGPRDLLYLDHKAKLPYYIKQDGDLIMFDPDLGIKLKLADGDISILMESDSFFD